MLTWHNHICRSFQNHFFKYLKNWKGLFGEYSPWSHDAYRKRIFSLVLVQRPNIRLYLRSKGWIFTFVSSWLRLLENILLCRLINELDLFAHGVTLPIDAIKLSSFVRDDDTHDDWSSSVERNDDNQLKTSNKAFSNIWKIEMVFAR